MPTVLNAAGTPTESVRKASWLNFMDDTGEAVEAVRSSFMQRGRAEVWRRDDAEFAEGFDARYGDVDRRILNTARQKALAGDLRAAALCLRPAASVTVRSSDDSSATGVPPEVASAMLAAGLAAMGTRDASRIAFESPSVPSHACPPAPRRRNR